MNKKNVPDVMSLDATMDDSTAIVKLTTPYTIDSDTLYIGYSFDVVELTEKTALPISLINEKGAQGLWAHSNRTLFLTNNQPNHTLFLTLSSCHPKFFVKEFCYFLMPYHHHGLRINLLVQR